MPRNNAELAVNLKPATRPGTVRLLQRDFCSFLERELQISKPTPLQRIKQLSDQRLLVIDHAAGPRKTCVTVDASKVVNHMLDNDEGRDAGDPGPLGMLSDGEEEFARITAAGFLEEADWESPFSESFLEAFRQVKKELMARYPNQNCTNAALAKIIQDAMPDLSLNQLVNMVALCYAFSPFADVRGLPMAPHSVLYDYRPDTNLEIKRKLFESVLDPMPASVANSPLPVDWVRVCAELRKEAAQDPSSFLEESQFWQKVRVAAGA